MLPSLSSSTSVLFTLGLAFLGAVACSGDDAADTTPGTDTDDGDDYAGVCGNESLEDVEICDGTELAGKTCADQPGFVGGTLACAVDCTGFDTAACTAEPSVPLVRLNELTASDVEEGTYAGAGDAIELYNAGGTMADLSGWQLSDETDFPADKTFTFAPGTTLAPGEFLVIIRLDDETGVGDYPFGISQSNPETLGLRDTEGTMVDSVSFAGPDAVISWCRVPDGDGDWQFCALTLGSTNMTGPEPSDTTGGEDVCGDDMIAGSEDCDGDELGGADCASVNPNFVGGTLACTEQCTFDTRMCEVDRGAAVVVLNELTSAGNDEIEVHNPGDEEVDISGWILTDDLADPRDPYDPETDREEFVFAAGTVVAAGGFLVVPAGDLPDGHPFGLSGNGDAATLLDASLVVQDFVAYGMDEAAVSYCRMPDGPLGAWQAGCDPSFGESNQP